MAVSPLSPQASSSVTASSSSHAVKTGPGSGRSTGLAGSELAGRLNEEVRRKYVKGAMIFTYAVRVLCSGLTMRR